MAISPLSFDAWNTAAGRALAPPPAATSILAAARTGKKKKKDPALPDDPLGADVDFHYGGDNKDGPWTGINKHRFNQDPERFLSWTANQAGMNTSADSPFGSFAQGQFADIINEYDFAQNKNKNLDFLDFMKKSYGAPKLLGKKGKGDLDPTDESAALRAYATGEPIVDPAAAALAADAAGGKKGKRRPTGPGVNPAGFDDWLRRQFYGASAKQRGVDLVGHGAGSTRWSAYG